MYSFRNQANSIPSGTQADSPLLSPTNEDGQSLPALGGREIPLDDGRIFYYDPPILTGGDPKKNKMISQLYDDKHAKMVLQFEINELMEHSGGGTIYIGVNENGYHVGLEPTLRSLNISKLSELVTYVGSLVRYIIGPKNENYWSLQLVSTMDVPYIEISVKYFDEFESDFL